MVATRLAVLAPERVASLTLVCATAGGWQSLPCSWRVAKYGLQARPACAPPGTCSEPQRI